MNKKFSFACRKAAFFITISVLLAGSFQLSAQDNTSASEVQQYARIENKIKPASSTLSIDLPFTFDGTFTDEEIPDDMKSWIKTGKRCQMLGDDLKMLISYTSFSMEYTNAHMTGVEDEWMKVYLTGSMVETMKDMEARGQISSFSHRVMDIKLTGSKDKALLLKGRYRESPQNFEVWVLQILHKKDVWQLLFFFDPKDLAMQDAVEAACFSASVK